MKKILAKSLALLTLAFAYVGVSCTSSPKVPSSAVESFSKSQIEKIVEDKIRETEKKKITIPKNKGYDNDKENVADYVLEKMLNTSYELTVHGVYKNPNINAVHRSSRGGSCFLAETINGRQYFVTCAHVVHFKDTFFRRRTRGQYKLENIDAIIYTTKKGFDLEIIRKNRKKDLAVLVAKKDLKLRKLINFADKKLMPGDAVFAVGFPADFDNRSFGKFLTKGNLTGFGQAQYQHIFYGSASLDHGNSGGPVYVIKDGEPYIAGVAANMRSGTFSTFFGAVHYKHAKKELDKAIKDYEAKQKKESQSKTQTQTQGGSEK